MDKVIVETRKEWVAPELKKVDIEQVTAYGTHTNQHDAFNRS